ncbi:hypothetical protein MKX03_027320 [Papaver bracteatum]|nr:hypothetical protein MKX03_027320 [Papaver bracteatum]
MAEILMSNTNNTNGSYSNRTNSSVPNAIVPINDVNSYGNNNDHPVPPTTNKESSSCFSIPFFQKLIAEGIGTFFMIFSGCAAVNVNLNNDKVVTLPGIALTWGLAVMVMIYALGYISGAHFNPAVTIAFATCGCGKFPWKQVPGYVLAQVAGSTLAIGTLRLLFQGNQDHFLGTLPAGSHMQSLVLEFITTFYLMFVICSVATDSRAVGELAGLAIGSTVIVNILCSGPISGASLNPARSLGPALVFNRYEGLWIYIIGPVCGAIAGSWTYSFIKNDCVIRKLGSKFY